MNLSLSQSSSENLINLAQHPLIICHKCRKSIPFLSLSDRDTLFSLRIKCINCNSLSTVPIKDYLALIKERDASPHYCGLKEDHFLISAEQYCLNCGKWLCQICIDNHSTNLKYRNDLLISQELSLNAFCATHIGRLFAYYCNDCSASLCQKCFDQSHFNHNVVDIEAMAKEVQQMDRRALLQAYKSIREKNAIMKDSLIHLLDMEIEQLNKVKEYLQSAYEQNERNNEMIEELFVIAHDSFKLLKNVSPYELLNNLKSNFAVNRTEVRLEEPTIKANCANCIRFLLSNHIVTIKNDIKCIATIPAHNDGISCLLQLIDCRLASGSFDTTIKVWNTKHFNCEITLHGHEQKVYALAQLANGRLLSGSLDCTVRIWDVILWKCIATIDQHTNSVFALVTLSNNQFASGSGDKTIKFWDNLSCNYMCSLEEHTDAISCLIELNDGRLASGSWDNTVRLWNLEELRLVFTFDGHSNYVTSLVQLKDGRLASGSSDRTIRIWDIKQFTQVGVLKGCQNIVFALVQLKDCGLISGEQSLRLWTISSIQSLLAQCDNRSLIRFLIELKDGRIVSGSDDNNIKIWRI